ncbi:TPA: hypothetical protein EYP27_06215 [Candidatus Bathyarchaeota archaeon]|nr:hypothetical protein [Candidatus Bathyarchaeota archaeon]
MEGGRLRRLFRVLLKLKHEGFKQRRLLCPRCGSNRLKPYSPLNGWLTPTQYICEECGYKGAIVLEEAED